MQLDATLKNDFFNNLQGSTEILDLIQEESVNGILYVLQGDPPTFWINEKLKASLATDSIIDFSSFLNSFQKKDQEYFTECLTGTPKKGVVNIAQKTGEEKNFVVNPLIIQPQNGIGFPRIFFAFYDISPLVALREKSEKDLVLLSTIMDFIPMMVVVKDINLNRIYSNKCELEFIAKLGFKAELSGKDNDIYPAEIAAASETEDLKVLHSGKALMGVEVTTETPQGNKTLVINKIPLRDSLGKVWGIVSINEDITDRNKKDLELKGVKEQFEAAVEGSNDGIWDWQIEKNQLFFSSRLYSLLGYQDDELETSIQAIKERLHPSDLEQHLPRFQSILNNSETSFKAEVRLLHKDGNYRWMLIRGKAVKGQQGQTKRISGSISDISDRKENEIALENTKSILEQTNQIARIGGWEINFDTNEYYWTAITKEIHEVAPNFVPKMGVGYDFYKEGWHRKRAKELVRNALKKGEAYDEELLLVTAKGNERWVRTVGKTIFKNGKCQRLFGIVQDIHERKQLTEDLLQKNRALEVQTQLQKIMVHITTNFINLPIDAVDASIQKALGDLGDFVESDRVYVFDYDFINNTTSNTFEWCAEGIEPQIEYLQNLNLDSLSDWVVAHKVGRPMYIPNVADLDPESMVYQILAPQDIKSIITLPMLDDTECLGFVGFDSVKKLHKYSENEIQLLELFAEMLVNINKRRRLIQEIVSAKEEAETANQSKSEFLANMSHEIRTPLNGVIGFTDLLMNTELGDEQLEYVQSANSSAHSLLGIINDILDFSKIEAGKLELDLNDVNLLELIEQTADIVKYNTAKKNIEFLLNVQLDLPHSVHIDPIRLKQIIVNLLSNAVKFTSVGEVELIVTYEPLHDKKQEGLFTFSVRDTGIGISQEQQAKLFKSFSQADTSTTRKFGGTGLGLVISEMLAQKMGSSIKLESNLGQGSTFSFSIVAPFSNEKKAKQPSSITNLKRVLIIDDNDNNRFILREMLHYWGIQTLEAPNGIKAISILKKDFNFDGLIVDHHMPYMDGIETIAEIRKLYSVLTPGSYPGFILYSSADDGSLNEHIQRLKINRKLVKPAKISELFEALNSLKSDASTSKNKALLRENNTSYSKEATILVAEDVSLNMLLIKTFMKNHFPNIKVIDVDNGKSAVEAFEEFPVDLILMDIQMPELDGYQATQAIRKYENQKEVTHPTPIIALTAGAIKGERERCLDAGMNDYLTKPIEKALLIAAIKEYLKIEDPEGGFIQFDEKPLLNSLGGDRELLVDMLRLAMDELTDYHKELKTTDINENPNKASRILHKMKGIARNLCFLELTEILEELERNFGTNEFHMHLLPKLTSYYQRLLEHIEEIYFNTP